MSGQEKKNPAPEAKSPASLSDRLSILAIILAALSLGITVWAAIYQQQQWRLSSAATVDPVDASFVQWRTLTSDEVRNLPPSEPVDMIHQLKGSEATGLWSVRSELVALHRQSGELVAGVSAVTVPELEQQLKARSLGPTEVEVRRHSRVNIELKNSGPTPARNVRWICTLIPSGAEQPTVSSATAVSIPPGGSRFGYFDRYGPANAGLPEKYCFNIQIRYDTLDQTDVGQDHAYCYDKASGMFSPTNVPAAR